MLSTDIKAMHGYILWNPSVTGQRQADAMGLIGTQSSPKRKQTVSKSKVEK